VRASGISTSSKGVQCAALPLLPLLLHLLSYPGLLTPGLTPGRPPKPAVTITALAVVRCRWHRPGELTLTLSATVASEYDVTYSGDNGVETPYVTLAVGRRRRSLFPVATRSRWTSSSTDVQRAAPLLPARCRPVLMRCALAVNHIRRAYYWVAGLLVERGVI
jgi:hypothetical protein